MSGTAFKTSRIALFADQLVYKQPGGIGAYLRHLVPGLAGKMGGSSLVLAHHGPEGVRLFPDLEGVEEVCLGPRRDIMGLAWHTMGRPRLERYLGRLDLVHAPSLVFPPSRAPMVATVHDLCILKYPETFPARWRIFHRRGLKLILRKADLILAVSNSTYHDLSSLMGVPDQRVRVIPQGVDQPASVKEKKVEEVLDKYGLDAGYILFVGTIEPRKNLSRLARAYSDSKEGEGVKGVELVLAGAPGWMGRRELSRIMSQPGVKCLGFVPWDELEALYKAAALFVYPSLYEGFGLPVLEAMARGLPVVTSDTSAMREVGEGAALLVDPTDPGELAGALRRLIDDHDLRGELAEAGRARAAEYPWERTVRLTLDAYSEVLG